MLLHGDCLTELSQVPDDSVGMVFADLPYGVTANKWDVVIPLEPLWAQLLRIGKPMCAYVFTATQPFATTLINSQPKLFRYDLVWEKTHASGFVHAKRMPLRCHEHILVFSYARANSSSSNAITYNPQKKAGKPYTKGASGGKRRNLAGGMLGADVINETGSRYPRSIVVIKREHRALLHPTQKPVALLEWLIKTYTNPGDTVLDPTAGSGTTAVAAINTGRDWVCIERDAGYCEVARKRIHEAMAAPKQGALAL